MTAIPAIIYQRIKEFLTGKKRGKIVLYSDGTGKIETAEITERVQPGQGEEARQ